MKDRLFPTVNLNVPNTYVSVCLGHKISYIFRWYYSLSKAGDFPQHVHILGVVLEEYMG